MKDALGSMVSPAGCNPVSPCVRIVVASNFLLEVEKCEQDLHNHLKYRQ